MKTYDTECNRAGFCKNSIISLFKYLSALSIRTLYGARRFVRQKCPEFLRVGCGSRAGLRTGSRAGFIKIAGRGFKIPARVQFCDT